MCKQIWQQGPAELTWAYFPPITNYLQFILNQYQEVGQKPLHSATPKKQVVGKYLLPRLSPFSTKYMYLDTADMVPFITKTFIGKPSIRSTSMRYHCFFPRNSQWIQRSPDPGLPCHESYTLQRSASPSILSFKPPPPPSTPTFLKTYWVYFSWIFHNKKVTQLLIG